MEAEKAIAAIDNMSKSVALCAEAIKILILAINELNIPEDHREELSADCIVNSCFLN